MEKNINFYFKIKIKEMNIIKEMIDKNVIFDVKYDEIRGYKEKGAIWIRMDLNNTKKKVNQKGVLIDL